MALRLVDHQGSVRGGGVDSRIAYLGRFLGLRPVGEEIKGYISVCGSLAHYLHNVSEVWSLLGLSSGRP